MGQGSMPEGPRWGCLPEAAILGVLVLVAVLVVAALVDRCGSTGARGESLHLVAPASHLLARSIEERASHRGVGVHEAHDDLRRERVGHVHHAPVRVHHQALRLGHRGNVA